MSTGKRLSRKQVLYMVCDMVGKWPSDDSSDSDYEPDKEYCKDNQCEEDSLKRKVKSSQSTSKRQKLDESASKSAGKKKQKHQSGSSGSKLSSEQVPSGDGIDRWGLHLPELVLHKIYGFCVDTEGGAVPFLCRVSRVNRLWNRVSTDPSLWKKVDLSYGWIRAKDETLKYLCKTRFSHLREINLSNWKKLTDNALKLLADTCPGLKSLSLSRCCVKSSAILYLTSKCTELTELDLSHYKCVPSTMTAKTMAEIVDSCAHNLVSLNLSSNCFPSFRNISDLITTRCHNLEVLDLCNVMYLCSAFPIDIETFQRCCPRIKILRFVNTNITEAYKPNQSTEEDETESPGFPLLTELSLGRSEIGGAENVIPKLLKTARGLRLLDLRGWLQLRAELFEDLPADNVEHLHLSHAVRQNDGIEKILAKWRHSLVELDLSWNVYNPRILDAALSQLAKDPATSRLEILNLQGIPISAKCVRSVITGCRRLQVLDLCSCRSLPRGMKKKYYSNDIEQLRREIDSIITEYYSVDHSCSDCDVTIIE